MRQSAGLVFNPIMVDSYDSFFNFTQVGRASDSVWADIKLFTLVGWDRSFLSVAWPTLLLRIFSKVFWCPGISVAGQLSEYVSPRF